MPPSLTTALPSVAAAMLLAVAVDARAAGPGAGEPADPKLPLPAGERCAAEPLRPSAVTYVCDCAPGSDPRCKPGDDGNGGRKPGAPLRSYRAAVERFRSMDAGGTVAFCRGGRWEIAEREAMRWVNFRCRADRTCDVRDYAPPWGDGTQGRPQLVQAAGEAGLVSLVQGGEVSPHGGYRFLNLELRGSGRNTGFFVVDGVRDVTICNDVVRGFAVGVDLSGSAPPVAGSGFDARNARVAVVGNRILDNAGMGLLGGCDDCTVEGNLFEGNGGPDGNNRRHSIYVASPDMGRTGVASTIQRMRVAHNTIRRSAQRGASCVGVALVVHGRQEGLVVEDNLVEELPGSAGGGCYGIAVGNGGYPFGCWFREVAIRRNVVRYVGNLGIGVSSCTRCAVENNLVVMDQDGSGIFAGTEAARADPRDEPDRELTIRNNTVYFTERVRGGTGIGVTAEGAGHAVVNNAIAYAGKGGADGWSCLDVRAPASLRALDHNLCWFPGAPTGRYGGASWQGAAGTIGQPLAAWRESSKLDAHSLQVAPRFLAPPGDLTPGPGSPLAGAGAAAHAPSTDLLGRPRGPRPAIGALEP